MEQLNKYRDERDKLRNEFYKITGVVCSFGNDHNMSHRRYTQKQIDQLEQLIPKIKESAENDPDDHYGNIEHFDEEISLILNNMRNQLLTESGLAIQQNTIMMTHNGMVLQYDIDRQKDPRSELSNFINAFEQMGVDDPGLRQLIKETKDKLK